MLHTLYTQKDLKKKVILHILYTQKNLKTQISLKLEGMTFHESLA